ncbi:Hypothetical protein FKW44_012794, partial [Caligus rogercresseyi]
GTVLVFFRVFLLIIDSPSVMVSAVAAKLSSGSKNFLPEYPIVQLTSSDILLIQEPSSSWHHFPLHQKLLLPLSLLYIKHPIINETFLLVITDITKA